MAKETDPRWANRVHRNLVRAIGGVTLLGEDPDTLEKLPASHARIQAAVRAISGKTIAEVARFVCASEPAKYLERVPVSRRSSKTIMRRNGKKPTSRELIEGAVAIRWGYSIGSLRALSHGRRTVPIVSKATRKSSGDGAQFFADLQEFGGVTFAEDGRVTNLGKGPDSHEYVRTSLPGSDSRCKPRPSP